MFYCMYNGHADITRMVEANGELAEKYYYDEWGVETESLKYGDISGDGKVTVNDYSLLKRILYVDQTELTHDQQLVSDLNADGKTDTEDLNILKQILFSETDYCKPDTNKDGFVNEKNNIRYAGYFYDAETGLYYLNARFYDPETARFIQQDSYSGDIYDPLSLNLYTYSNNNPISYYDPTGHSAKNLFKKAKDTINVAVSVFKPVVKSNTKELVKAATNAVVKNVVEPVVTKVLEPVVTKVLEPVVKITETVQKNTASSRNQFQAMVALGQVSEAGTAINAASSYYQGIIDTVDNGINGLYQLYENPANVIGESAKSFASDPLKNNPVYAYGKYCYDIGRASYAHDWDTVSYKLGVGAVNISAFYVGAKATSALPAAGKAVSKTTSRAASSIGNSIRNALNSLPDGTPALVGANGIVMSGSAVSISAEAELAAASAANAAGVKGALASGIKSGVVTAAAAQNIVYSKTLAGQSDSKSSSSTELKRYSDASNRYNRKGYTSGNQSSNLFAKDKLANSTQNITEWRRSIDKSEISKERRLFLGDDYVKIDSGKWRSLDGKRQFRVKPGDYKGGHGIGNPLVPNIPHVHFEFLEPRGNKFRVKKNIHVPLK